MDKIAYIRENFSRYEIKNYHFCVDLIDCISEIVGVILDDYNNCNDLGKINIQKNSDGLCVGLLNIKESCIAAWQDMIRIDKYGLSICISNDND